MKSLFSFFLLCFFALPAWGQTSEDYFKKGCEADGKGDYKNSIDFYTKAIELAPDFSGAYYRRGNAKKALGWNKEATKDLVKAEELMTDINVDADNKKKPDIDIDVDIDDKKESKSDTTKKQEIIDVDAPTKRFALIVGNNAYEQMNPLTNAINDSKAIADRLSSLGFEVIRIENADKATFEEKIGEFSQKLKNGGTGLFYYAGHGVQYDNKNYLLPADADTTAQSCIAVDVIQNAMENRENAVNILILDACRSNARGEKDKQKNFVKPSNDARGSVLAFSTSPEKIALDGSPDCPRNSVYTCELLKNMKKGVKLEDVFKHTREGVIKQSQNFQIPWEHSSLIGEFEF